jgi:hypothetical protein
MSWCWSRSLSQTCYLELARGFIYTLHVSPHCDGAHVLIPEALKGPPTFFLQCLNSFVCLSWPKVRLVLHASDFRGRHVFLLSVISSTWIAIETHETLVNAIAVFEVEKFHSFYARPSFCADLSTYVQHATVYRLRLVQRVVQKMAQNSSTVSHTGSRMVQTCCLPSPSAGLRPPPQLMSNWS